MIALIQRQLKTRGPLALKIRSFLIRQRWSPTQEYNRQRPNNRQTKPSVKEIENMAEFWGRRGKESELEIED